MKIWKLFKFSFIYFLIFPNRIALADSSQKEIIKWDRIDNTSYEINEPKWEKIDNFNFPKYEEKIDFLNIYKKNETRELEFSLTQLGITVPTAHTLEEGLWNIYGDQVFPISEGEVNGSANQNYSIFFNSGMTEKIMISTFFAIADDPLHKKIYNRESKPSNLWLNLGGGAKLKIFDRKKLNLSIASSLEFWKVKSGGCNSGFNSIGKGCDSKSSNIFNNNIEPVVNNNLVGSIAIPATYDISKYLNFPLVP